MKLPFADNQVEEFLEKLFLFHYKTSLVFQAKFILEFPINVMHNRKDTVYVGER